MAAYYKTFNINVSYKDIIVTTGASEALLFAFGSIMDPDDEIIISEPFYANYIAFSTAQVLMLFLLFLKLKIILLYLQLKNLKN